MGQGLSNVQAQQCTHPGGGWRGALGTHKLPASWAPTRLSATSPVHESGAFLNAKFHLSPSGEEAGWHRWSLRDVQGGHLDGQLETFTLSPCAPGHTLPTVYSPVIDTNGHWRPLARPRKTNKMPNRISQLDIAEGHREGQEQGNIRLFLHYFAHCLVHVQWMTKWTKEGRNGLGKLFRVSDQDRLITQGTPNTSHHAVGQCSLHSIGASEPALWDPGIVTGTLFEERSASRKMAVNPCGDQGFSTVGRLTFRVRSVLFVCFVPGAALCTEGCLEHPCSTPKFHLGGSIG